MDNTFHSAFSMKNIIFSLKLYPRTLHSHTKASDEELWRFLWSAPRTNGWVNNRDAGGLRTHRAQYDVILIRVCIKSIDTRARHACGTPVSIGVYCIMHILLFWNQFRVQRHVLPHYPMKYRSHKMDIGNSQIVLESEGITIYIITNTVGTLLCFS